MPNIQPMSPELQAFLTCPVFLLPLAWVGWAFCATQSDAIVFSKKELLGLQYTREIESLIAASVEKVETGTRLVEEACRTMKEVVTNANQFAFALNQ